MTLKRCFSHPAARKDIGTLSLWTTARKTITSVSASVPSTISLRSIPSTNLSKLINPTICSETPHTQKKGCTSLRAALFLCMKIFIAKPGLSLIKSILYYQRIKDFNAFLL